MAKEVKKHQANEILNQYLDSLEKKQQDVEVKNKYFLLKQEERSRRQKEIIELKKAKKEQVL